jgi:hypothetical protein
MDLMAEYIDVSKFVKQQRALLDDAKKRIDVVEETLEKIRDARQGVRRGSARWLWLKGKYRFWLRRYQHLARLVARYTSGPDGVRPSAHFSWFEFADSKQRVIPARRSHRANIVKSARNLERLRAGTAREYKKKAVIAISSGVRTPSTNAFYKGEYNSYHTERGRVPFSAVDIRVYVGGKQLATGEVERLSNRYCPDFRAGGSGVYNTFNHRDHRGYVARWDRRT